MATLLGYEKNKLKGKSFFYFIDPDHRSNFKSFLLASLKDELSETIIIKNSLQNKNTLIDVRAIPLVVNFAFKGIYILARDVTVEKQTKEDYQNLKNVHSIISNNVSEGICGSDGNHIIVYWNRAAEHITGYSKEEVLGKNVHSILIGDNSRLELENIDHETTEVPNYKETKFLSKSQKSYDIEYTVNYINYPGTKVYSIITFKDITIRKKLEKQMIEKEKLAIAGELAAGIAHEIRNPLTTVKGFIDLLQIDPSQKEYLRITKEELEQIDLISGELLILAKPEAKERAAMNVVTIVKDVGTLLRTQASMKSCLLHIEPVSDEILVLCNKTQLRQALVNFMKNAIEAVEEQTGQLVVNIVKENEVANIYICDNGSGIPEHLLNKLGEPFYTTKDKGTGLGFMVSKKIIEDHGGNVSVLSTPVSGTTISIQLPTLVKKLSVS